MNRILILDDNKDFGDATREALEFFDYEVIVGLGGDDAIKALEDETTRPDVILTDLNMPDISGEDILNITLEHPEYQHIKVIIMSGANKEKERLLASGARGFIEKPFKFSELHSMLMEILADTQNS